MARSSQMKQNLLACARKRKGWTQAYVAQQVAVSVETVRQWERSRHLPYQATIQQLCDLFQMAPEELGLLNERPQLSVFRTDETSVYAKPFNISRTNGKQDEWQRSTYERKAAWEIHVELVTRISATVLDNDKGLLREALSSLHSLFSLVRTVLRNYDPTLMPCDHDTHLTFCTLAVRMLNTTLRPLLSKWHPLLKDYEDIRPESVGAYTYERQWERLAELRQEIAMVQTALTDYANSFAQIAEVPSLVKHTIDNTLRTDAQE